MSRIYDAKAGEEFTLIFHQIDFSGNLVSGAAATTVKTLRDEDGAASEIVTVDEQGTSGFYEARFTPTKSKATGRAYFLRIKSGAGTDGGIVTFPIRVFPTVAVSGVTGNFLTVLANVKEYMGITGTQHDALLTNLLARASRMIEWRLDRVFVLTSWQEIRDGQGRSLMVLRQYPVTSVSALYVSGDQVWDATTLVDPSDFVLDKPLGRIRRDGGLEFPRGFQNVRIDYESGFASIPLDVEQFAIELVSRIFRSKDQPDVISMSLKDGSLTRSIVSRFGDQVIQDLGAYARREAA